MKSIVAVVLAILAVQYVQSQIPGALNSVKIIETAINTTKAAIQLAQDAAHGGIQKGIDAVDEAFANAESAVDAGLTAAIEEIIKLKETAEAAGVDTAECTDGLEQKLNDLRDETVAKLDEVGTNTTDVLKEVQSGVDGVLQGLVDVADGFLVKFENCKSIICQTKVILEASPKLLEITSTVPVIAKDALADALTTSANGVKAVGDLVVNYEQTIKTILEEIAKCIDDIN